MIDLHTHVLPGLDDGPRALDEAVAMCARAAEDGIRHLVATPHLFTDADNPAPERIGEGCAELRLALRQAGIPLELGWSAEVRLVENLPARVRAGTIPTLDPLGRYVLLEPPRVGDFAAALQETVFRLQLAGITPVIAHPEYVEMFYAVPDLAERLVRQGALLQLTASSVVASAAEQGFPLCLAWLRQGLIHVIASDAHNLAHRPPLLSPARAACAAALDAERAALLVETNPARILAGEAVVPLRPEAPPAAPPEKGIRPLLKRLLQPLQPAPPRAAARASGAPGTPGS